MQNVKTVARRAGLGIAVAGVAAAATIAPASAYAEVPGATTTGTVPSNTAGFDYAAAEASNWTYSWTVDANGNTNYTYGNGATSAPAAQSTSYEAPAAQSAEAPAAQASGLSTQSTPSAPQNTGGIAGTAQSYVGSPYVWGGTSPGGWDCSGFVQYVYAQHGINLPRVAAAQGAAGTPTSNPQPGDLVVQNGGSHIGIYLGNGQMVSALNPGQGTQVHPVSAMSLDYYATFG